MNGCNFHLLISERTSDLLLDFVRRYQGLTLGISSDNSRDRVFGLGKLDSHLRIFKAAFKSLFLYEV